MSTMQDTNGFQKRGVNGYMLAMENMDASSPAAKIVGEELDAFFERAKKGLMKSNPFRSKNATKKYGN